MLRTNMKLIAHFILVLLPILAHGHTTNCSVSYDKDLLMQTRISQIDNELNLSLKKRPGLQIKNILWVGQPGIYKLQCARYLAATPIKPFSTKQDTRKINGWTQGRGDAQNPGHFTFNTNKTSIAVKVYPLTASNLKKFGLKIAKKGQKLKIGLESVQAQYLYGPNYFNDWVMRSQPLGGSRIERHPSPHLITLAKKPENGKPSYLLVGRINKKNSLELGLFKMKEGIPIIIPANTVHSNDYFQGLEESVYPRTWGVDEVIMINRDKKRVTITPK
jgi:hypothetical protein